MFAVLRSQGFEIRRGNIASTPTLDKESVRALNEAAVREAVAKARPKLIRHEQQLIGRLADSSSLDAERIQPRLVEVESGSEHELLFRWARLHWSVPTAPGYGRRQRFLVIDEGNDKLIGLIGLCDGVFSLPARDEWIGWTRERRRVALRNVMHAHVLGAVPPYSHLLGGKLVAMLATSIDVREAFSARYSKRTAIVSGRNHDGVLALMTTTGALGRSSVYNRLRYSPVPGQASRLMFTRVGFAKSSAQPHFPASLCTMLEAHAAEHCQPTRKHVAWGKGFRSRREAVDKALIDLGLNPGALAYGLAREVWCAPLGANATAFLRGEDANLEPFRDTADELSQFWRERWLLPRAARDLDHPSFSPDSWRLWPQATP
ncbi:MAG TPA: Druantia anti-phage system protein DruA [Methyloceanibacter sp.]|nr:Druantia anti-phage system protein DruA [Methyloceanibacter sp.]